MAGIAALVEQMNRTGAFQRIVNNPISQLGPPSRTYIGAQLLPEKLVQENLFSEQGVQYRTIIANDASRYSPVQLKSGVVSGSMDVKLGDIDTGSSLSSNDYDALINLLRQTAGRQGEDGGGVGVPTMQAAAQLGNWADTTLNQPLIAKMELQRWQAIVNAQVLRTGDNGFSDTVNYPNPTGHRPNAGGVWSSNAYDPYIDIMAGAEVLAAKGYRVSRIITSTPVRSKLTQNTNFTARIGHLNVVGGVVGNVPRGRATLEAINQYIAGDGLPPIELYDQQYRTSTGSGRFMPSNCFVMIAETGRDQSIDRADLEPLPLQNTLGYQAVGRAAGQSAPGRQVVTRAMDNKPPRIEGEAWATTLPVILEPEAIFVIRSIT